MQIIEERIFGNLKIVYKQKADKTYVGYIYHKRKRLMETSAHETLLKCKNEAENYAFDLNCEIERDKAK